MSDEGGEKTEKPTQKKLREATEKGDVLASRELGTALVVLGGGMALALIGPIIIQSMQTMLVEGLTIGRSDLETFDPASRAASLLGIIALPICAIFAATLLAAIAAPAILGSLGFRASAFKLRPEKLNPASGIKRMFGVQGLIELGKSLAKVALLGSVGVWIIHTHIGKMVGLAHADVRSALGEVGTLFIVTCLTMGGCLLLIAGMDVPAQIFQRAKRLNMSKQEVKDEHKETEGSPELKGHIRRRQYEMLSGSARKAVTEASVVLTNPTHFAVALRYRPGEDAAPIVVARGRGATADAIRELAGEHDVPLLNYPELTRAIYYTSRAGHPVDQQLYLAVATVLAFIFRLDAAMATEMDRPHIELPEDMLFDTEGRRTGR